MAGGRHLGNTQTRVSRPVLDRFAPNLVINGPIHATTFSEIEDAVETMVLVTSWSSIKIITPNLVHSHIDTVVKRSLCVENNTSGKMQDGDGLHNIWHADEQ